MRFHVRIAVLALVCGLAGAGNAGAAEPTCLEVVGLKFAQELKRQCTYSSATDRPCAIFYPCDYMLRHIRQNCQNMARDEYGGEPLPADSGLLQNPDTAHCRSYLEVAGDFAPSFDCAKAQSATEKAICADRELSQSDVQMAAAYARALATESTTGAEQRAWLKERDTSCNAEGRKACLAASMKKRIDDLNRAEVKNEPSLPRRPLAYEELIGRWEVRAVRVDAEPGEITNVGTDDWKYMGFVVAFAPERIEWIKPQKGHGRLDDVKCVGAAGLAPWPDNPTVYSVRCGEAQWRYASVKSMSPDTVRLYWDNAVLTLRRVKD